MCTFWNGARPCFPCGCCSAAAVVRRLYAKHSLPLPDVAEALILHLEACMPPISRELAGLRPEVGAPAQEQPSSKKAHNSSSQGAAEGSQTQLYQSPVMQGLRQSWQVLADLICQARGKANKAGNTQARHTVDCHNRLAFGNPVTSAGQEWNSLMLLLESRAWWWDKAVVFDADVQAYFLETDQAGVNATCAMAIVSDCMLMKQSRLEGCELILRRTCRQSQNPTNSAVDTSQPKSRVTDAVEVLSKLR